MLSLGFSGSEKAQDGELRLCEGDCDSDSECGEGLKCFQRYGDEDVPGCPGEAKNRWDYCVKEEALLNVGFYPNSEGRNPRDGELRLCDGDCDNDSECGEGLRCYQRGQYETQDVPGCFGEPEMGWDYCVQEAILNTGFVDTGDNPRDGELRLCEGDCDSDSECGNGLECYQRDRYETQDVPGCVGEPEMGWDYCVPEGSIIGV